MGFDIERLMRLALIYVDEDEASRLVNDLKRIMDFFNKINSLDVESVDPLYHVLDASGKLRSDKPEPKDTIEWIRRHSRVRGDMVVGPRTIVEE